MHALGRLYDVEDITQTTAALWLSMKECATVTILAAAASGTQNLTVQIAADAAGTSAEDYAPGSATPALGITSYHRKVSGVWALTTQAAAATVATTSGTKDLLAIQINAAELPKGFPYITAFHANAKILAIRGDLVIQRAPAKLRSQIA